MLDTFGKSVEVLFITINFHPSEDYDYYELFILKEVLFKS